jgi:hypothetical protein
MPEISGTWNRNAGPKATVHGEELTMRAVRPIRSAARRTSLPRAIVAAVLVTALGAVAAAAGFGLKPGLWEIRIVKSVVDGRDNTASIMAMTDKMQQMLTSLPADQRAMIEAKLKQSGVSQSNNGSFRMCVSPAMAKLDKPIIDKDGRCQPAVVQHDGSETRYQFNCTVDGTTTVGKGTATANGDSITTHVEMTVQQAGGQSHTMQNDTELSFIGADCGDVQPADAARSKQ